MTRRLAVLILALGGCSTPMSSNDAGAGGGGFGFGGGAATGGGVTGGGAATGGSGGGGSTTGGGGATGGGSAGPEYFVSPSGDDMNAGTMAAPFKTIQKGVTVASAGGGTVTALAGTYSEKVTISTGTAPLVVRGMGAIIDGTGLTVSNGQQGLITIDSRSDVTIDGFELRNFRSTNSAVPLGIYAFGSGSNLTIRNNHIHDIVTTVGSCNGNGGNAFGLAVYGSDAPAAWTNVLVTRNELDHLTLGCSESLSINGNVDGFEVSFNSVHDNDNIGIVAIGFEDTSPMASLDQARNGVIRKNTVSNITSVGNPAYGTDASADGIYVDGGKNILIEQNVVRGADLGIEIASEHSGKSSSYVLARSNVITGARQAAISLGGYDNSVGNADHDVILNNTTADDVVEVQLQFHVTTVIVQNNVLFSPNASYFSGSMSGVTQVTNLIRAGMAANTFVNAPTDLHLVPALDAVALNAGSDFTCPPGWTCPAVWGVPLVGAEDVDGAPRVVGMAIDLGAWER